MPAISEYTRLPSELLDLSKVLRRGAVYIPSDVLVASNDAQSTTKSSTFVKKKTIYIPRDVFKGVGSTSTGLRIKFDIKTENTGTTVYGQIYKNGAAVGTIRSNNTETFITYSEDITGWEGDDTIELWGKTGDTGWNCYLRNFRVYGDETLLYQADVPQWS